MFSFSRLIASLSLIACIYFNLLMRVSGASPTGLTNRPFAFAAHPLSRGVRNLHPAANLRRRACCKKALPDEDIFISSGSAFSLFSVLPYHRVVTAPGFPGSSPRQIPDCRVPCSRSPHIPSAVHSAADCFLSFTDFLITTRPDTISTPCPCLGFLICFTIFFSATLDITLVSTSYVVICRSARPG